MKQIMTIEGQNGQITLYENFIAITRKGVMGFLGHGFDGGKFIFLNAITSVQYKEAGMVTSGFIQFGFSGGSEAKGGLLEASKDENTVTFSKSNNEQFKKLLDYILERKSN